MFSALFKSITLVLTKLLLTAMAVEVNPELAANVIFHTGVFLIVKPVQSPTDNCVHLNRRQSFLFTGNVTIMQQLKSASENKVHNSACVYTSATDLCKIYAIAYYAGENIYTCGLLSCHCSVIMTLNDSCWS